jgi:cell division septum initiation protein DivIVA
MNSSYYQNRINQLDKEIADLETKIAAESKIEADKSMRIINTQKSITKYTSASTVSMKMRQILSHMKMSGYLPFPKYPEALTAISMRKQSLMQNATMHIFLTDRLPSTEKPMP